MQLLRTQPNGVAKSAGVLQCTLQHLCARNRHLGLTETYATRSRELAHFGQYLALQAHRECPQRQHTGLVQFFGAVAQHFYQSGLVQHRVGVGGADQTGHATGHGGGHFALEHARMFLPGFAQTGRQINQAGGHNGPAGVDHPVGRETSRGGAHGHNAPGGNGQIDFLVEAAGRVHDTAVLDQDFHGSFLTPRYPPRCSSPPCARQCRKSPAARSRFAGHRPPQSRSRHRG